MKDINLEIYNCTFCPSQLNDHESYIKHSMGNHAREFNSLLKSLKNINGDEKSIKLLSNVQLPEKTEIAKYEAYLKMNNIKVTIDELRKVTLLDEETLDDLRCKTQYKELVSNFMNTELTKTDITFLNFDKVVQCTFCTKSFKGIPGLKSHMRMVHNVKQVKSKKGREWNMDEIDKLSELELKYFQKHNRRCLSSHLKDEMNEKINELNWIRYYKPYVMRLHKLFVQNDIDLPVDDLLKKICEECNTVFEKYNLYESHYREKHEPREDHPTVDLILDIITSEDYEIDSEFLNKYFNVSSLDVTQQNEEQLDETTVVKYSCEYCEEAFERKKTYKSHMKHSHPNENGLDITVNTIQDKMNETFEFSCKNCSKIFHKESKYIRHMEKCQNEVAMEIYNCEYCLEQFYKRKRLRRHIEKDHPEKSCEVKKDVEVFFNCEFCAERFATKEQYNVHQIQNHKSGKRRTRNSSDSLSSKRAKH